MNIGFIGTGSMGTILIDSFIRSGALAPWQMVASNRTRSKVEQLAARHEGLRVAGSNREVAEACDILFLCVKPSEYGSVVDEIGPVVTRQQTIVSITSPVMIRSLEERLDAKIAKIIPSITNYVLSGPTLCMYSERLLETDIARLEDLLGRISRPVRVSERYTRVSSDIASCGPAFFSFLLQRFIDAAVTETGIEREHATRLGVEMLLGTGMLLTSGGLTPESLQQRVSVPGGITAQGLRLMDKEVGDLFRHLIRITHAKYDEDVEKVNAMFAKQTAD